MLGKKITVTVAQPEVQLAGEGRKVLYKGSVALGDHSSPKPVYLISYGDPKPEQPATVIAVVSSKGKEQFVAAPENTVYYAPEIRSVIEKAEGRPPERVSCLYEKSCGAVVYRVEGRTVRFLVVKNKNGRHWGFPKGHMEYGESERQTALREVLEETGLKVEILPGFRETCEYCPYGRIRKQVVFFAAKSGGEEVVIQRSEIDRFKWARYEDACELFKYDNDIRVLQKAKKWIYRHERIRPRTSRTWNSYESAQRRRRRKAAAEKEKRKEGIRL